jgi:acetyl esterase/lipase
MAPLLRHGYTVLPVYHVSQPTGDGGPPRSFLRAFDQDPVDMPRWRLTAAELSPLLHVTGEMPPVLIHHGDRDTLVTLDQSVRFRDRAAAVGGDVTLVTVAGAGHTWLLMPWHIAQCAAWFDTRLAAPGRNRP